MIEKQESEAYPIWPGTQWLVLAMVVADWPEHAACQGREATLWDPVGEDDQRLGKGRRFPERARLAATYCWGECPVRAQCHAYAAAHHCHGVWGGYWHSGRNGSGVPIPPAPLQKKRLA